MALSLAALAALAVAGVATAGKLPTSTVRAGNLKVTFGGAIKDRTMPKHEFAPFRHTIFGKIQSIDGTHPSALRELVFDVDKDVKINTRGYPVCRAGVLEARDTDAAKRVCGQTLIGEGKATAEIAFAEQEPIEASSPVLVFNGGESKGEITLLIHVFITVPVPVALVTRVTVQRNGTGVHAVAKVPAIAGGSGSAVDFRFTLGKSYRYNDQTVGYFEARCPDGVFKVRNMRALFENEAGTPGVPSQTVLKNELDVPCAGKG